MEKGERLLIQENTTITRMRMVVETVMEQEGVILPKGEDIINQWEDGVAERKELDCEWPTGYLIRGNGEEKSTVIGGFMQDKKNPGWITRHGSGTDGSKALGCFSLTAAGTAFGDAIPLTANDSMVNQELKQLEKR